jgi:hypothetical protein
MEDIGTYYDPLVYFTAVWYILWLFRAFLSFWYVAPRKIWQPCSSPKNQSSKSSRNLLDDISADQGCQIFLGT